MLDVVDWKFGSIKHVHNKYFGRVNFIVYDVVFIMLLQLKLNECLKNGDDGVTSVIHGFLK